MADAILNYYDYPYDVTIGLEQALSVDFPAVTVCNINPARYTQHGYPDSKIHVANVGPTWGRQDPGGPHVGHTNLAIWDRLGESVNSRACPHRLLRRARESSYPYFPTKYTDGRDFTLFEYKMLFGIYLCDPWSLAFFALL